MSKVRFRDRDKDDYESDRSGNRDRINSRENRYNTRRYRDKEKRYRSKSDDRSSSSRSSTEENGYNYKSRYKERSNSSEDRFTDKYGDLQLEPRGNRNWRINYNDNRRNNNWDGRTGFARNGYSNIYEPPFELTRRYRGREDLFRRNVGNYTTNMLQGSQDPMYLS